MLVEERVECACVCVCVCVWGLFPYTPCLPLFQSANFHPACHPRECVGVRDGHSVCVCVSVCLCVLYVCACHTVLINDVCVCYRVLIVGVCVCVCGGGGVGWEGG